MKRLLLALLLLFPGCSLEEPVDYGELLFTMNCAWTPESAGEWSTEWVCQQQVDNEFVSGFLALGLMKEEGKLAFCGRDLITNTEDALYDALAESFTRDQFNCMKLSDDVPNNCLLYTSDAADE